MKQSRRFAILIAVLMAGVGLFAWINSRGQRGPLSISFWYWHSPFKLSAAQTKELQGLGVTRLFVRAGTFTTDGQGLKLMMPQVYGANGAPFAIHLVFNFDGGVIRHFEALDLQGMAAQIASRVKTRIQDAKAKGVRVEGIQFDLDCPTRLLPKYTSLLRLLRPAFPGLKLSVTGLWSWLGTRGLRELSRQVDFLAPQAYEGEIGGTLAEFKTISNIESLENGLGRVDDLECPVLIGLPAYGHALLYDEKDRLEIAYHDLSPQDALRHPSFKFRSAKMVSGEEVLTLKAVRPALGGGGLAHSLAYSIPTPAMLAGCIQAVKKGRPDNCEGIVVYRIGEDGDSMCLPLESVARTLNGHTIAPELKVSVQSSRESFDLIETDSKAPAPTDVTFTIENLGSGGTFISPDAVAVELSFDGERVEDVRLRDMNGAEMNKTGVRFRLGYLGPKQIAHGGPIRLVGNPKKVKVFLEYQSWDMSRLQAKTMVFPLP